MMSILRRQLVMRGKNRVAIVGFVIFNMTILHLIMSNSSLSWTCFATSDRETLLCDNARLSTSLNVTTTISAKDPLTGKQSKSSATEKQVTEMTSKKKIITTNKNSITTTTTNLTNKSKPNFAVLLTCSDGFFEMWENWLAFFTKLEIPNLPVHLFAEDKITYEKCLNQTSRMKRKRNKIKNDYGSKKVRTKSNENEYSNSTASYYTVDLSCLSWETVFADQAPEKLKAFKYRSEEYIEMMSHRPYIVQRELQRGYDVIFSDVDVIWLKSPLPYFENDFYNNTTKKDGDYGKRGRAYNAQGDNITFNNNTDHIILEDQPIDIWAQVDLRSNAPVKPFHNLCPGFMVFRSSPKVINLVEKWGNVTTQGQKLLRNQGAFNTLIWRPEQFNISETVVKVLPMRFFVTGKLYFEQMSNRQRKKAVVVHNNGIGGYDKKVDRLKNFSLWMLDE
mmetsp:Transcript_7791/g.16273  ORF Transcript_7791/g.16273 Transcript_7791/m.16273 type:complete len:448 (-) Transcript_7791:37-1380(-)